MKKEVGFNKNSKSLPKFKNSWSRLPEYVASVNEEVEALQVQKSLIASTVIDTEQLTSGTFIIGDFYTVTNLQEGDDFSNTGYLESNTSFKATETTPINWSNGSAVTHYIITKNIIYNDIDPLLEMSIVNNQGSLNIKIVVTNNMFIESKLFVINNDYVIINDNEILIPLDNKKFKIEIYI